MTQSTSHPVILCAGVVDPYLPGGSDGAMHTYAPGERLEGLPDEWAPMMHDVGVSMMQFDMPHVTTPEVAEGVWEWSRYDQWTRQCRDLGFQIMLFPHWHWPPAWYIENHGLEGVRCLEHDLPLPCFSPWDPATRPWFERCTAALAHHCRTTVGPPDGFFIGVHGDYGECMYPMGSVEELSDRFQFERGESVDHSHSGFWCGDRFARADFRATFIHRYGDLDGINHAWATDFDRPEAVTFPAEGRCERRAWLDFVHWYMNAMTVFARDVAAIYRHHFPDAVLTVPLGGGVEPVRIGQDNSALARAMVATGTAVRSTANTCCYRNPDFGPVERFARSYAIVKRVSSACRHYGATMWLEPPYPPSRDAVSVTAGVFEALSCAVTGCLDWGRTFEREQARYRRFKGLLRGAPPRVDTAVYFPTTSHRLRTREGKYQGNMPDRFWDGCCALRPYRDYDVVDEHLVADGALDRYRWLLVFEADIAEAETVESLDAWTRRGGIAVVAVSESMQTVDGDTGALRQWLGLSTDAHVGDTTGQVVLGTDPALHHVVPESFHAATHGWRGAGPAVTPLVSAGETLLAWRHDVGQGSVHAQHGWPDGHTGLLDLYRGVAGAGNPLPGAVDLCHTPADAEAVYITHFEDGMAVLNLNDTPIELEVGSAAIRAAAQDITWIEGTA